MIDLYYWPTPNGHKITIALEEMGLAYNVIPIDIGKGAQFTPEFLALNPNHRMPVITDPDGPGGEPYSLFESGAILIYLADKTGQFMSSEPGARYRCLEWLMFQMGGVGPMYGQANHFRNYAPEKLDYAIERYTNEARRLFNVLNTRLGEVEYLAGDYTIADMATFPWARIAKRYDIDTEEYPHCKRWLNAMYERPAVRKGLDVLKQNRRAGPITDEQRENMFGATQYQRR